MLASSIDEVIVRLDAIVEDCIAKQSRLGIFPAVYCQVTVAVRDAILAGRFEDGPRMARFDTVFANKYLSAYDDYHAGKPAPKSWRIAFQAIDTADTILLQHLLLGMNAHINLDLGIAAAEICPGERIADLHGDYLIINEILASRLDALQAAFDRTSPLLAQVDVQGGRLDEHIATFSMVEARDQAWQAATMLARLPSPFWSPLVELLDRKTSFLARLILRPGPLLAPALRLLASQESRDIAGLIRGLRHAAP